MRVLESRREGSGGRKGHPTEERTSAAQLATLQHEVEMLRRERRIEAASLATPKKRAERMSGSSNGAAEGSPEQATMEIAAEHG